VRLLFAGFARNSSAGAL
jgi:hypothetical protein